MILTVTLNLAVDLTYSAARVGLSAGNRVRLAERRAGGKGVSVARVLRALGREVMVTGLAGGFNGAAARAELHDSGLADETVPISGESRITIVVVDEDGGVTGISEPGPDVLTRSECLSMRAHFRTLVVRVAAVVLSGSLPPGIPLDAYALLAVDAADAGVPVLLDAEGEALLRGVTARPPLVKINAEDLAGVTPGADALSGAARLRDAGAGAMVISEGADGLLGVTDGGTWRAAPAHAIHGNPTGAGNAASPALIAGPLQGKSWPDRLADAAALSAAAVGAPLAGSLDPGVYRRLCREVVARPVDCRAQRAAAT